MCSAIFKGTPEENEILHLFQDLAFITGEKKNDYQLSLSSLLNDVLQK